MNKSAPFESAFFSKTKIATQVLRCLFCFLLPLSLQAQYDDLLQNSKISWVAEYTTDYELNPAYNTKLETEANLLELDKLLNTKQINGLYPDSDVNIPYYFSQQIHAGIKSGIFNCYADADLSQPLTADQIASCFQWKDSTDRSFIAENEYGTEAFVTFRVRQVFFYNQSKRCFGVRLLAIAPIPWTLDPEGYLLEHPPLLWIKPTVLTKKQQKKLPKKANYILQTRMMENSPAVDQMTVKKGQLDLKSWTSTEVARPSHRTLSANGYEPLSNVVLKNTVYTADTITALNDQGQSVIDQIIQNNAIDQVEKIRFVQNWYYDEQHGFLDCQVTAVAPMATISAAGGLFQFDKPLFYIKY